MKKTKKSEEKTPNLPLFKIHWEEPDVKSVENVLRRGTFWADGPEIREFEKDLSSYTGRKYCLAFNSGTSALHTLLLAHDLKDKEVIVQSFTFVSTANAVVLAGGRPVFAEVEEETFGLDAEDVKQRITPRTKAIILMHYGGCVSRDTRKIKELTDKHNLILIEDAAESLGAQAHGIKAGNFGQSAILSFCQNKTVATGEGGAIITDDELVYNKAKLLRSHGRLEENPGDYFSKIDELDYIDIGYNYRMPTICAALGISQLKNLEKVIKLRQSRSAKYSEELKKLKQSNTLKQLKHIRAPIIPEGHNHVFQMYPLLLDSEKARNALQKYLQKKGIMSKVYFSPVHLTTYYQREFGCRKGDLPKTEDLSGRLLVPSFYPDMTDNDIKYVIGAIREFYEQQGDSND
ncbi:DegT/DnrJ/EryC1/StrS family aminotransferase [Candidatus Woesearchaeota archaeon]|nr:DegT/DnrJ/EryC1/StrS family aminotransferase [Candidatus Woesearchaeota archaeon]